MALPPIPNWKTTEESHEAYKPFSQFHCYPTWNYNDISSPLWVPTESYSFYHSISKIWLGTSMTLDSQSKLSMKNVHHYCKTSTPAMPKLWLLPLNNIGLEGRFWNQPSREPSGTFTIKWDRSADQVSNVMDMGKWRRIQWRPNILTLLYWTHMVGNAYISEKIKFQLKSFAADFMEITVNLFTTATSNLTNYTFPCYTIFSKYCTLSLHFNLRWYTKIHNHTKQETK
jgi:hypothetical protein